MKRNLGIFAAMLVAGVVPASANLVTNGTFLGPVGSPFSTYTTGQTFAGSWTVTASSVDWVQQPNFWGAPPSGGNSVDLDGSSVDGGIEQIVPTVSGQSYLLTFQLNSNSYGPPNPKLLSVNVGGADVPFSLSYSGTGTVTPWNSESLLFTAVGPTTLKFTSTDTGTYYGPVIADVSVELAPEPALYGLLFFGLGGLVAVRRSRRKA